MHTKISYSICCQTTFVLSFFDSDVKDRFVMTVKKIHLSKPKKNNNLTSDEAKNKYKKYK